MKGKIVLISGVLGVLLFSSASIIGGLQIEGYSFIGQYISESYATGLPNTEYLRNMYIASGFLIAVFGFTAASIVPPVKRVQTGFVLFGIFYGLGTVVTGLYPCDLGCQPDPELASLSQFVHNAAGFLTYSIVPFCLVGIGFTSRQWKGQLNISRYSIICGLIALGFVVLLFSNPTGTLRGLVQRVVETAILFWIVRTAFSLLNYKPKGL